MSEQKPENAGVAYPDCTCGPSAPYDSHEWDCPRNPQNLMVGSFALTDEERERLATWLRHHGVYSFGLLCDIADCVDRLLAARSSRSGETS